MNIKNYFLILLAIFFCAEGHAKFTDLIENSPFIPEGQQSMPPPSPEAVEPKVQVPDNKFVLKGIVYIGNEYLFSIYDETSKRTEWLSPNETVNGFTIRSYDPEKLMVYYEWNGIRGSAQLKDPNDSSVELTFLNENGVNKERENGDTSYSKPSNNQSTRSKVYKQLRMTEKIVFSTYGSSVARVGKNKNSEFVGENLFASTNPGASNHTSETSGTNNIANPPTTSRYKVKRTNKVNNASGKLPR